MTLPMQNVLTPMTSAPCVQMACAPSPFIVAGGGATTRPSWMRAAMLMTWLCRFLDRAWSARFAVLLVRMRGQIGTSERRSACLAQNTNTHVRFLCFYVRFIPESGHSYCKMGCLLWANSWLMHRSMNGANRKTAARRSFVFPTRAEHWCNLL